MSAFCIQNMIQITRHIRSVHNHPSVSCTLPYPDNFFFSKTWNASAPPSLTMQATSFPHDNSGNPIDPIKGGWDKLQGFGTMPPIMMYLPNINILNTGFPRLWDIGSSLKLNSLLLDANTMQPVDHWVELDASSQDKPNEPSALILWPSHQLNFSTTYIVAIRNAVDVNGNPIAPSEGFSALVRNTPTNNPALEASRPRFNAIFAKLNALGWDKTTLTLAWDFTTSTRDALTGAMVFMRDDALLRTNFGRNITYRLNQVTDTPGQPIARQIFGQFQAPLYLNTDQPGLNVRLVYNNKTGLPQYQGMTWVNFTVLIPASLTNPPNTGKVVYYGHGLFGSQAELLTGYLDDEANQYQYVLGGVDWWGLSEYDEAYAAIMVATDLTNFPMVPDRCHQGMLNALLMMKFMTESAFTQDPAVVYGGVPVVSQNPADRHYYGNSNGGILGSVYMSLTTDVLRGVLGVGGGPYSLLLPRSQDFAALLDVIHLRYSSPVDRITLMTILQSLWDTLEPSSYMSAITADPFDNTPVHTVAFHYGLGDAQVTWLGCHMIARSVGAYMYESNVREGNETLTGFPFISDSTQLTGEGQNLVQGWQFPGVPEVPFENIPPGSATDTHEKVRRTATAQQQTAMFFWNATIVNTCGGACVSNSTDEYL